MEHEPETEKPNFPNRDKQYREMYSHAKDFPTLNERADALAATLCSVVQELEVLKEMLHRKNGWDGVLYRELRVRQMLSDHDSAGPAPWRHHSIYPYALPELDFLRSQLSMSEEEVKAFQEKAAVLRRRT